MQELNTYLSCCIGSLLLFGWWLSFLTSLKSALMPRLSPYEPFVSLQCDSDVLVDAMCHLTASTGVYTSCMTPIINWRNTSISVYEKWKKELVRRQQLCTKRLLDCLLKKSDTASEFFRKTIKGAERTDKLFLWSKWRLLFLKWIKLFSAAAVTDVPPLRRTVGQILMLCVWNRA